MFSIVIFASHWLKGTWYPPEPDFVIRDINGDQLSIGSRISIVGTVVAINPRDYSHGSVSVLPDFPGQSILGVDSLATTLVS